MTWRDIWVKMKQAWFLICYNPVMKFLREVKVIKSSSSFFIKQIKKLLKIIAHDIVYVV